MKGPLSSLVLLLATTAGVLSHGDHRAMHPREIASRQLAANKRHIVARNCAPQIAAYQKKRKLARRAALEKRAFTNTATALEPHETSIKNSTCVTAPEVTEGPYYLNNDLIRQDVRENQGGFLLELDIGVIDTSTCQPLPDALVEIWHCNATGSYSGFSSSSTAENGNGNTNGNTSMSLDPNASMSMGGGNPPDASQSGATPSGTTPSGGGGMSGSMTDSDTFLRGGWPTNEQGIVTFNTIYPGYYTGRTIHIHTMVHQNITYNTNGTYTSRSGSLVHVGQMFFNDDLNDQIVALAPYSETTQTRSYNTDDSILAQENSNGYSAYVDAELLGTDPSEGILGFITIGVDSTAKYEVTSWNYYTGGDPYEAVTPSSTGMVSVRSSSSGSTTGTGVALSGTGSTSDARGKFAGLKWLKMATGGF